MITSKYLEGGRAVVGKFEDGMISLMRSAPKGTAYHEGFHAVFRTMLSTEEQTALLKDAKDITAKPTDKELFDLEVEFNIDRATATTLYYEESMADMFAEYMNEEMYNGSTGIRAFFAKIAAWIKNVFVNVSTTRSLFHKIKTGKYTKSKPNVVRGAAYKVHPTMDVYEVQQSTREMVSLAFADISTIADLESASINFKAIEPKLRARMLKAHKNGDKELTRRIGSLFAQGTQNLDSFWYREMDSYMRQSMGLKRKTDEALADFADPESQMGERSLMLASSYNVSGKVSATASVKFLVAMTQQTEIVDGKMQFTPSPLTGVPQLVDFGTTYNDLENLLSGIVSSR